jgi:hypothetical protein
MVKARPGLSEERPFGEPAAGNGMLSRRVFLEGAVVTGAAGAGVSSASAEPLVVESWMKEPGAAFAPYGQPSRFEDKVVRAILSPPIDAELVVIAMVVIALELRSQSFQKSAIDRWSDRR